MTHWEQYEIWVEKGTNWELLGVFADQDLASALALERAGKTRLVHLVYEDAKVVSRTWLSLPLWP